MRSECDLAPILPDRDAASTRGGGHARRVHNICVAWVDGGPNMEGPALLLLIFLVALTFLEVLSPPSITVMVVEGQFPQKASLV